jgi:hypothetical protein
MAQTKTKSTNTKKRSASKSASSAAKSKSSKSKSQSKPKAAKPKSAKAKSASSKSQSSNGAGPSNGASPMEAIGKVAGKAKVPLVAGGAAIAGAAGGLALAASKQGRKKGIKAALPRKPKIKIKSGDVAKAAKEVGNFGAQVGELATELQRARESADGKKHRSPVEVVLQGLTARR